MHALGRRTARVATVGATMLAFLAASAVASAHAGSSVRAQNAAKQALLRYLHTHRSVISFAKRPGPEGTVYSYNWSGYADTSSTDGFFTKVSGDWKQPGVTCNSVEALAATWVGIDGYSSDTVEQDGTLAQCYQGAAYYYSWWEMYPSNDIQVVGDTVAPGDKIVAAVNRKGSSYTLKVTDSTNPANSFKVVESCSSSTCVDTSAEWIMERPCCVNSGDPYPLADYGKWKLTSGAVTGGGTSGKINKFNPQQIDMVNDSGDTVISTASALSTGNSFTTTWDGYGSD
jgi:hypothetical protein